MEIHIQVVEGVQQAQEGEVAVFESQDSPYRQRLQDGLILRSVETEADVENLAAFNGGIHSDGERAMTEKLLFEHPLTTPRHWLMICEEETGDVVATLCLIPWTLSYCGVPIKSAEVGIVGTREDFRHRGLQ